ncbi:MAG: hypothetical protein EOO20_22575 [Chryseobacterium sp.]|nr:MAG: hypothetical protein EOO20_22575 [Chryseobacterium sp.]
MRKTNTLWSVARKEDFFSANPLGHGLGGKGIVQKFASQNAYRYFIEIRKRKQMKKGLVRSNIGWQFPELRNKYLLKFASSYQDDYFG